MQAAAVAGVDALVAVYHSDHRELCAHERDWPFRIMNMYEIVGASMGLQRDDQFKRLKMMQGMKIARSPGYKRSQGQQAHEYHCCPYLRKAFTKTKKRLYAFRFHDLQKTCQPHHQTRVARAHHFIHYPRRALDSGYLEAATTQLRNRDRAVPEGGTGRRQQPRRIALVLRGKGTVTLLD